jgi:hypothetical protein
VKGIFGGEICFCLLGGEILYLLGGDHCWWKEFCLLGEEICESCCCLTEEKIGLRISIVANFAMSAKICKKASAHEFATSAATVAAAVVQQSTKKTAAVAGSGTHNPQQQQS